MISALVRALAAAGLMLLGLFGLAFAAEEPAALEKVGLMLYPEYDDPRLLVIVAGHLSEETPLPVTIRMLMPTAAALNAVAFMDEQGDLVSASPTRQTSATPGWDEVGFEVNSAVFQFEYYHDAIEGGPDKSISFDYRFLYPVNGLTLVAQQPKAATDFVLTPTQQTVSTDSEGFRYYRSQIERLEAGQPLRLEVSYTKTDPSTSVAPLAQTSSTPTTEAPDRMALFIALGGGVVAVAAAFFIVMRRRRPAPALSRAQRRAKASRGKDQRRPTRSPSAAVGGGASSRRVSFCRQCGARLGEGARFCPQCGERIG